MPIAETAPTRPTNPYGASKLAVDHDAHQLRQAHGFAAVSLRYFNVAGARIAPTAGALGERHATETHLIPIALQVAAGQRDELQVFGTDYPTPDGTCVRDYIHVLDLADAHLRALDWQPAPRRRAPDLQPRLGIGFVGARGGRGGAAVTGRPTPAVDAANRPGDPAVLVASNARAARRARLATGPRTCSEMVADAWAFVTRQEQRAGD